jgi:hypothetical protein
MDVEEPTSAGPAGEGVHDSWRRGHERAGAEQDTLVPDQELSLSFEHVERIHLIVVGVWSKPLEAGLELELDQRELLSPDLDRRDALLSAEALALGPVERRIAFEPERPLPI